jgi:LysM repeat protein
MGARGKTRTLFVIYGIVVVVCAALAVVGLRFMSQLPDVASQMPPAAMIVTLSTPPNGSTVQLNAPTLVEAQAVSGTPIAALELWVDGALAQTSPPSGVEGEPARAFWTWTPTTEGEHVLVVRAVDENDRSANSNVVRVTVSADAAVLNLPYTVQPGDTIETLAEDTGASAEDIIEANPGVGGGLTPGQDITIPIPPPPQEPPEPTGGASEPPPSGPTGNPSLTPPSRLIFWITGSLFGGAEPPAAPTLSASVDGCSVNLFVTDQADNESGFFIYRYGPDVSDFTRIATLGSYSDTMPFQYTDEGLYGTFLYYVTAFNAAGETASNIISATVSDAACLTPEWEALGVQGAQITTSTEVDRLYCYFSVDHGVWSRIPADPQSFIYPVNGSFDVSAYLETLASPPPEDGVVLSLECWGWAGDALAYLGSAEQTLLPQPQFPLTANADLWLLTGAIQLGGMQTYGGGFPAPSVSAPYNLQSTRNPQACFAHLPPGLGALLGELICGGAIADGYTALLWDWVPGTCWPGTTPEQCSYNNDIDGFRLYEIGPGHMPYLIQTTDNPNQTLFALPAQWPRPDGLPRCYGVTAYAGILESRVSTLACLTPTGEAALETITLHPADLGTITEIYAGTCTGPGGLGGEDYNLAGGEILAGYDGGGGGGYGCFVRHWYEGAARFDLSPIGQASLQSATLRYYPGTSVYYFDQTASNEVLSCANQLSLATADWSHMGLGHIPSTPYHPLDILTSHVYGQALEQDVLSAVVYWRDNPSQNHGFVLSNVGPVTISSSDSVWQGCWTHYYGLELEVTYFTDSQ